MFAGWKIPESQIECFFCRIGHAVGRLDRSPRTCIDGILASWQNRPAILRLYVEVVRIGQ
jgi:hypothetical protein